MDHPDIVRLRESLGINDPVIMSQYASYLANCRSKYACFFRRSKYVEKANDSDCLNMFGFIMGTFERLMVGVRLYEPDQPESSPTLCFYWQLLVIFASGNGRALHEYFSGKLSAELSNIPWFRRAEVVVEKMLNKASIKFPLKPPTLPLAKCAADFALVLLWYLICSYDT